MLYHITFGILGLGLVIYGVFANTKSQTHLRKKLLKKYLIMYALLIISANFFIIPFFSLLKK